MTLMTLKKTCWKTEISNSNNVNGECDSSEDFRGGYDQQKFHTILKFYYICTSFEMIWIISF
jgi:hypothetical protein